MTQYMLMFSLGPVQTFIAQARKTRDLWLGSFLLSALMEAAMNDKDLARALVFPVSLQKTDNEPPPPKIDGTIPDLPNKYVAVFNTPIQAHKAATDSEDRIRDYWKNIHEDIWTKIVENPLRSKADRDSAWAVWDRQTKPDNLFEIFWVIVAEKPGGYKQWLKYTEELFDARKRLRDFVPQIQGEPGEKSTISGEREALHAESADRKGVQDFWIRLTRRLSAHDIGKDGSERLDAIDTVKRFATKSPHIPDKPFPSTSSIATASFVERLLVAPLDSNILKKWQDETRGELIELPDDAIKAIPYFQQMLSNPEVAERKWILRRDGDLYFPETFVPRRLEKDYNVTNISDSTRIAMNGGKALTGLLRATDSLHITRPTPYYALIQMDGDKMGILLSGVKDQSEHVKISEALSMFSRQSAPELVEDHYPGRLVYAGGDDVFALAPLARDINRGEGIVTVLDLVDKLQEAYRSTVQNPVSDSERKQNVTASTGIAIAHHFTSLSYVRRVAKASEDLAKDHYGRNALIVTVIRRSGEQTRVGCHWRYPKLADEGQPIRLVTRFHEMFKHDLLSPKCVHILLEEAPALVKLERDAQKSEIRRVLLRQSVNNKQEEREKKKEIGILAEYIVNLAEAMDNEYKTNQDTILSVELHSDNRRYGLVEVLGWLLVAAFLARKDQE